MMALRFLLFVAALGLAGCAALGTDADARAYAAARGTADRAYAQSDWQTAVVQYTLALEQVPGDAEAWLYLGNAYSHVGEASAAIASYQQALSLDQGNAKAWFNLGVLLLRDARQAFAQAERHALGDAGLSDRASQFYERLSMIAAPATAGAVAAVPTPVKDGDHGGDK